MVCGKEKTGIHFFEGLKNHVKGFYEKGPALLPSRRAGVLHLPGRTTTDGLTEENTIVEQFVCSKPEGPEIWIVDKANDFPSPFGTYPYHGGIFHLLPLSRH